ncbi:hypothetical protein [Acidovorax sp. T1]|uniref:hypothetical protein n=1 Tax=Acidovorax sp. T1 TaxID=1858609 RepID=UPI000B3FE883|nr:hypothetical protein [Acidovorax sp. T1]
MSCQQVPTTPALNPYPRSVQVGEFEVAIDGGIWVAIRARQNHNALGQQANAGENIRRLQLLAGDLRSQNASHQKV